MRLSIVNEVIMAFMPCENDVHIKHLFVHRMQNVFSKKNHSDTRQFYTSPVKNLFV